MNAHSTLAGLENQAFALMGRLHVILRRQSGRVTDVEYMRIDPVYCRYLLKLAREMPHEDLQEICSKLEEVYFGPEGLFVRAPPRQPLLAQLKATAPASDPATSVPAAAPEPSTAVFQERKPAHETAEEVDQHYIGRLR